MTQFSVPLVGAFNDRTQAEGTIDELHQSGVPDHQIHFLTKESDHSLLHLLTGRKGEPQKLEHELIDAGIAPDEAHYYRDEYEAGHVLVIVAPGNYQQQALNVLRSNGAHMYPRSTTQKPAERSAGAITPGMRPEDSSQDGIATTTDGTHAIEVDDAVIKADMEHLRRVFDQKRQI